MNDFMIEMEVVGVAPEPNSNRPLVWLKDKSQKVFLPIAIGNFEATAIFMELHNEPPPRPITYDLLRSILESLKVAVKQVIISSLRDDTFFAEITLSLGDQILKIDSRPSDAIALALRVQAPIFVDDRVIKEAGLEVEKQSEGVVVFGDGEVGETPPLVKEEEIQELAELEIAPVSQGSEDQVAQKVFTLKAKLQKAVAREEYEEAAKLRDEIGRLES